MKKKKKNKWRINRSFPMGPERYKLTQNVLHSSPLCSCFFYFADYAFMLFYFFKILNVMSKEAEREREREDDNERKESFNGLLC